MAWTGSPMASDGVEEREFVLDRGAGPIPGVMWAPAGGPAERLLMLGHGGTADKRADYIVEVARLAVGRGFAALAIDGPGHGDRSFDDITADLDGFAEVWRRGGGTEGVVDDWMATLNFVESEEGTRPTAWWGLSMGTMMGLPVVANDPRISLAVLGLMGTWGPNGDDLRRLAPEVRCPLRFLVQWDDELIARDRCFELFELLGSRRKTLHANPGAHAEVPVMEVVGSVDYLDRHLG